MMEIMGQFTGMVELGDMAMTLCTDGVGTKLLVAEALDKWDTVGIDCIAMSVNDTICVGAEPVALVDYLAMDRPDERITESIGKGLNRGARRANIDIVGGEVAIIPELVKGVDLSASCLGLVKKSRIIDGRGIEVGDAIIGIRSSGVHSNGLTLARRVLRGGEVDYDDSFEGSGRTVGEELLIPTEIYVKKVLRLLRSCPVKGMVNVTGGGLRNFVRLRKDVMFRIDRPFRPQPIFRLIAELGSVEAREMYQTFNMGMGFAIVCPDERKKKAVEILGEGARVVGEVAEGSGVCAPTMGLSYDSY